MTSILALICRRRAKGRGRPGPSRQEEGAGAFTTHRFVWDPCAHYFHSTRMSAPGGRGFVPDVFTQGSSAVNGAQPAVAAAERCLTGPTGMQALWGREGALCSLRRSVQPQNDAWQKVGRVPVHILLTSAA